MIQWHSYLLQRYGHTSQSHGVPVIKDDADPASEDTVAADFPSADGIGPRGIP